MSFMLGVLGSAIFWIVYFVVSFFVGSILLKYLAPISFSLVLGQEMADYERSESLQIIALIFLFWPIILAAIIIMYLLKFILKFIIVEMLWPLFCKAVKKAVSIIPDIEIKKAE